MPYFLGVDLGGTKVDYVLADHYGNIVCEKRYESPFKKTSDRLPDGRPEVLLDAILPGVPMEEKTSRYLAGLEADFLREFNIDAFEKRGWSLCGKTWTRDGSIFMIGGNTPSRFAARLGQGKIGIRIASKDADTEAANDGNAAATAQGIYYEATMGIEKKETGYFILGTGFGFGTPEYDALTEIGHIPVGLAPDLLWQECGCTAGHKTACAENFASGRGIQNTAKLLISHDGDPALKQASASLARAAGAPDLFDLVAASKMRYKRIDARTVMDLAKNNEDGLAVYVANLAAEVTALAAVTAALQFGLRLIGIGEKVALANPWHVDNIAAKVSAHVAGSTLLRPPLEVQLTPLSEPAKYGALSLIAPKERYGVWAEKMRAA